jgi:hypothetical protein
LEEGKAIIIEGSHIDPNLIVDLINQRSFVFGNASEQPKLPYREIRDDDVDEETNDKGSAKKGLILAFFLTIQKKEEHHLFFEQWLSSRGAVGSIQVN